MYLDNIEEEAREKLKWWAFFANIWRVVDNAFVIISFSSSMAVVYLGATLAQDGLNIGVLIGSVLAAIFTVLSFVVEPRTHMRNYRRAFSELYEALLRYDHAEPNNKNKKLLIDALSKGEHIIDSNYEVEQSNGISGLISKKDGLCHANELQTEPLENAEE